MSNEKPPREVVEVARLDLARDVSDDKRNANKGTKRGLGMLEKSISQLGAGRSIVVDAQGRIVAGNKSRAALVRAGLTDAIVVETDGTTPVVVKRTDWNLDDPKGAARRYAYQDNRVAEVDLEWDRDEIAASLEAGVDFADLWNEQEMAALLGQEDPEDLDEGELLGEGESAPRRVEQGDLWQLGDHLLVCGDCRDEATVDRLFAEGERIAVAVTSPPYAAQREYDKASGFTPIPADDYVEWFDAVQANVARHLANDGSWFVNIKEHCDGGQRVLYVKDLTLAHVRRWGWRFVDEFCWRNTTNGVPGAWGNRFKNAWEPIFHFARGKAIKFRPDAVATNSEAVFSTHDAKAGTGSGLLGTSKGRAWESGLARPSNVLEVCAERSQHGHAAPYPIGLPAFFLRAFSDEGDIVYEPFCGSGTTLIASEQLKRRCRAVEISAKYCDVIVARWEAFTKRQATKVGDATTAPRSRPLPRDPAERRAVAVAARTPAFVATDGTEIPSAPGGGVAGETGSSWKATRCACGALVVGPTCEVCSAQEEGA